MWMVCELAGKLYLREWGVLSGKLENNLTDMARIGKEIALYLQLSTVSGLFGFHLCFIMKWNGFQTGLNGT